jgi:5,10-methylenetetrahydromethanopterin reductase
MRIGVSVAEPSGPDALSVLADRLDRTAADGFASAWMSQLFGLDTMTALAVAGARRGGGGGSLELGTAVVPAYPRHPAALAQQALTVSLALGGRFTLGLGLSHRIVVEDMYGLSYRAPARYLEEYLSVLLPLLSGEKAVFSGSAVRADIGLSAPAAGRVPVVLAALGPRLLELAGRRTDGTVTWMTGPATLRNHVVPTITAAAAEAGRSAPRIICILPVCVTDDVDAAAGLAARVFRMYNDLPAYRAMLDREGAGGPADVAIIGGEDAVAARLAALAEAGVTDFVAGEFMGGDTARRTRTLLADLAASLAPTGQPSAPVGPA